MGEWSRNRRLGDHQASGREVGGGAFIYFLLLMFATKGWFENCDRREEGHPRL